MCVLVVARSLHVAVCCVLFDVECCSGFDVVACCL